MQKLLIIILFSISCSYAYCQKDIDIRSSSYILGKQFYINKDYLNAYKYLLAYKFTNYDKLSKSENAQAFESLNNAIIYCESQIKKGLTGSGSWEGRGWSQSEVETAKQTTKESPPTLPSNHF